MNETSQVSNILENYADKERLSLILRLHKAGHVTEDEALNLLTGDRNYFLTQTIQEIKKALEPNPWNRYGAGTVYTNGTGGLTAYGNSITYTSPGYTLTNG